MYGYVLLVNLSKCVTSFALISICFSGCVTTSVSPSPTARLGTPEITIPPSMFFVQATLNSTPTRPSSPTEVLTPTLQPTPTTEGSTPKLAFSTHDDGIYFINADGTGLTSLTIGSTLYTFNPKWSPNGLKLAFISYEETSSTDWLSIWDSMSRQISLFQGFTREQITDFTWSQDSQLIAFTSEPLLAVDETGYQYTVYLGDTTNMQSRVLYKTTQHVHSLLWSPTQNEIFVLASNGLEVSAYLLDLDGNTSDLLTYITTDDVHLSWDPRGHQIAYDVGHSSPVKDEIFAINRDGTNNRAITHTGLFSSDPQWSPSGKQIAYVGYLEYGPTADCSIYVVDLETDTTTQVSSAMASCASPSWSSDGSYLAYLGKHERSEDFFRLYVYSLVTHKINQLADGGVTIWRPAWMP